MTRALFQKKYKNTSRGFTLVETLVAISIIMVGISATFSVVQFGLSSTTAVKDRITSGFLAQEALEAVRNMKDANLLEQNAIGDVNTPSWLNLISGPCAAPTGCQYNFGNGASPFTACAASDPCRLYIDADGRYSTSQASGAVASRFTRQIIVRELSNNPSYPDQKEAQVTVTIAWPNHSFVVTENITNWFAP